MYIINDTRNIELIDTLLKELGILVSQEYLDEYPGAFEPEPEISYEEWQEIQEICENSRIQAQKQNVKPVNIIRNFRPCTRARASRSPSRRAASRGTDSGGTGDPDSSDPESDIRSRFVISSLSLANKNPQPSLFNIHSAGTSRQLIACAPQKGGRAA